MAEDSRQLRSLHARSVAQLQALIPGSAGTRLAVRYDPDARRFLIFDVFTTEVLGGGRYQVAHAFLQGYLRGWQDHGG